MPTVFVNDDTRFVREVIHVMNVPADVALAYNSRGCAEGGRHHDACADYGSGKDFLEHLHFISNVLCPALLAIQRAWHFNDASRTVIEVVAARGRCAANRRHSGWPAAQISGIMGACPRWPAAARADGAHNAVVSALTLSAKLVGLLRKKIEVGVAGQFGGAQTADEIVAIFIEENDIRMTWSGWRSTAATMAITKVVDFRGYSFIS
jgi:hypothetical protein